MRCLIVFFAAISFHDFSIENHLPDEKHFKDYLFGNYLLWIFQTNYVCKFYGSLNAQVNSYISIQSKHNICVYFLKYWNRKVIGIVYIYKPLSLDLSFSASLFLNIHFCMYLHLNVSLNIFFYLSFFLSVGKYLHLP